MFSPLLPVVCLWLALPSTPPEQPVASPPPAQTARSPDTSPGAIFEEAWILVKGLFYDPALNGVDWDAVRQELLPKASAARDNAELSAIINDAVSRLHASHTHHYFQDQREYYELLDVFYPAGVPERPASPLRPGPIQYVGVGLVPAVINGHTFVSDVYDGGPADRAGILPGDELLAVEGQPWADVAPFRDRAGTPTTITIQRTPDASSKKDLKVVPAVIRPHDLFLSSIKDGARVVHRDGRAAAYVRIRSYAHPDFHEALKEALAGKFANSTLPLVLDLRGGWGGAHPSYMDIFNPVAPSLQYARRDGTAATLQPSWTRPVVMLIDEGSRSGKEVLAYAFKKHHIGRLVGQRTAGMVLGGSPHALADGSILYIAVARVTVDGETLEGVGVTPDVEVQRRLPYCGGKDEQLDAAVREAAVMSRPAPSPEHP